MNYLTKKVMLFSAMLYCILMGNSSANSFSYEKVLWCGEDERPFLLDSVGASDFLHHYLHFDDEDQIIVYNDGYQYATFEKLRYHQLYVQNDAVTHLEVLDQSDDVLHVLLKDLESDYTKHLIVNFNSMTYIARVVRGDKKYPSFTGVCEFIE